MHNYFIYMRDLISTAVHKKKNGWNIYTYFSECSTSWEISSVENTESIQRCEVWLENWQVLYVFTQLHTASQHFSWKGCTPGMCNSVADDILTHSALIRISIMNNINKYGSPSSTIIRGGLLSTCYFQYHLSIN